MSAPDRTLKQLSDLLGGGAYWRMSDAAMAESQRREGRPEHGWVYWNVLKDVLHNTHGHSIQRALAQKRLDVVAAFSSASVLTMWRMTKGYYEFAPELSEALLESEVNTLPLALLANLPEYAPYIAVPHKWKLGSSDVIGFWVTLATSRQGDQQLMAVLHREDGRAELTVLDIAGDTLNDCIDATWANFVQQRAALSEAGRATQDDLMLNDETYQLEREIWSTVLSLTLYLCSEEPDVTGVVRGDPEEYTTRHHGRRWHVPEQSGLIQVGMRYAGAIRMWQDQLERRKQSDTSGLGMPRAPHIRKAHWHLYWTGTGRSTPRVKWLQPSLISVRAADMTDFPVSYRPVLADPADAK